MLNKVWCLQLFADEEGTSASTTPNDTVVESGDDAQTMVEQTVDDTPQEHENPETSEVSFDDLIKGEYKKDFKKATSEIVKKRVKGIQTKLDEANARNEALAPMLQALGDKYRVDAGDYEGLTKAILNDKDLYEQEAIERGMDVDTLMAVKGIERENQILKQREQELYEEEQMRENFAKIEQEAEALQEIYPSFNLADEMEDIEFVKMLDLGFSVKNAYEALHIDDLQAIQAQAIEEKATERVVNSIKANAKRPSENGLKNQPGNKVNNDIQGLSTEDIDKYIERARQGEKISFT